MADEPVVPMLHRARASPVPDPRALFSTGGPFEAVDDETPLLDESPMLDETPLLERIEAAELELYFCLTGLERQALLLAAEADATHQAELALRARLIASDVLSRMGHLDQAKNLQLTLHGQADSWPAFRRRAEVLLTSTCDRRGEREESMRWISTACADWPEDDRPAWRAEALMVFALMSATRSHVDYSLARYAVAAVTAHCSPLLLSVTLANFAEVAAECGDLAPAAEFAAAASATLDEHPEVTATLTLDSIARALLSVGDTDGAIDRLGTALQLEPEIGCTDVSGDPWLTYAEALLIKGDAPEALQMLDEPRRADWAARASWTRSRDRKLRALILARLHRWEEAFAALLEHVEVYESVRSIEGDRVTAESATLQLANEERRRATRFEQLAHTDPLTGLPNRRQVDSWLDAAEAGLHIAIVDLDHFKRVNDDYSHAAGDLVLQRVADSLQSGMFSLTHDVGGSRVGRLGGEEFIVVWTNVGASLVTPHANRVLDRIRELRFPEIDPALVITASIGLAFHRTHISGAMLLAEADRSLYLAKRSGRDRVTLAGPSEVAPGPDSST